MGKKTIKAAQECYNSIELHEDRKVLLDEFDELKNKGLVSPGERSFYRWIRDSKL